MKLLVVRFSSIGDIVLTSPVVRCLKKQFKDAEIHFLSKKQYESVTINNPYIDKKYYFEKSFNEVLPELKKNNYDAIIDLQKNNRSLRLKFALGKKRFTFDKINIQKWLLVNFKFDFLPHVHIVDRYMEAVKHLGVSNDGGGLDYFITSDDETIFNTLPPSHKNYIGWVIGARHFTKRLPVEKLISIARKIKSPIILLGGKEDFDTGELLVKKNSLIINSCGKYSLNQSAALVKHADKIITHDTGLMHIAAAFKKDIVSVWGNTVPQFGMYPYYGSQNSNMEILEVRGLNCRPCSKIGFDKCPKGHFKCMREIDETIFSSL